jgi:transcriptional regulator with GAF, ATPase, and Fis domain
MEAHGMDANRSVARLQTMEACVRDDVESVRAFECIVGQSPGLRTVLEQVELVAPTEATVLISGESGTGKELVARAIHERSRRAHRPLVTVNCSAMPRELFESEVFGHTRGAFTGALHDRSGRFQLANGGTIFLDEIGDLPLELQPKLLRVLQEGQYERVGDDATRRVDVRVIAATNHDLPAEVRAGRFREDLYYRLAVFPIELPPLRARRDDIRLLVAHFLPRAARRLGIAEPRITREHCETLERLDWPGNVRELENLIERVVILSRDGRVHLDLVLPDRTPTSAALVRLSHGDDIVSENERRRRERANILAALERTRGRIYGPGGAAALLGVKPSTLQSRLRAFGVRARASA